MHPIKLGCKLFFFFPISSLGSEHDFYFMWILGGDEKHIPRKHLLVLGGDPKPKQKVKEENYISKKPRPLYNHCQ